MWEKIFKGVVKYSQFIPGVPKLPDIPTSVKDDEKISIYTRSELVKRVDVLDDKLDHIIKMQQTLFIDIQKIQRKIGIKH